MTHGTMFGLKTKIKFIRFFVRALLFVTLLSAALVNGCAGGSVEEKVATESSEPAGSVVASNPETVNPNGAVSKTTEAFVDEMTERELDRANSSPGAGNTAPLDDFELARYQYCGDDRDCVVSVNGCCDCANGGIEVAINRDRLKAFRERFDCLHMTCGMLPADPPCESGVVSCINHKCKYFPSRAGK